MTHTSIAADMARPEFQRDPYPFYARWRNDAPISFDPEPSQWLVTTYASAAAILRDARFHVYRPTLRSGRDGQDIQQLHEIIYRWLVFENPPDHTRLRKLVSQAFPADFVSDLRSRIESIVTSILDECAARGSFDLITDVAGPVSVLVIADALGLPRHDSARFRRWSAEITPLVDATLRQSRVDTAAQTVAEAVEYLTPLIEARRADPRDDVISRLVAARDQDAGLSQVELLATCLLLLLAGQDTTTALLGNGAVALLEHAGEAHRWRGDPALGVLAVEELLRFDSPIQVTSRAPTEDVEWGGATFARGSVVNILLGAANRDSAQFADPDRLDLGRTKNAHLAFGGGSHFCMGAGLARLVARIAIEQILHRLPNLELGPGDPVRSPGFTLRSFVSLPAHC